VQHAHADVEAQVLRRTQAQFGFGAIAHRLVGVEQHAAAVAVVAVQLDVGDGVVEPGQVERQRVVQPGALQAGFPRGVLSEFAVVKGELNTAERPWIVGPRKPRATRANSERSEVGR
jgi:hypothetical protein